MIENWRILFEVKLIPGFILSGSFIIFFINIPITIPNTEGPIIGKAFPKKKATTEITNTKKKPFK